MRSTMPKFVVPAVATTANTPSPAASSAVRSASPRMRPSASVATPTKSTSITSRGVLDRGVRLARRDDLPAAVVVGDPAAAGGVARGHQRGQVALRAARDEDAAGAGGQADEVGDEPQRLVLGVHRAGSLEPRAAVDGRRAADEIEQHRRLGGGGRDERQEARVVDRDARRREHVAEQLAAPPRRPCPSAVIVWPARSVQLGARLRTVERHRIHPQAPGRVGEDRLGELLGLIGVAMHPASVDCASLLDDRTLERYADAIVRSCLAIGPAICSPSTASPRTGR